MKPLDACLRRLLPFFLCLGLFAAGMPAQAQQQLEIIPLKSRSVEQVLPAVRPLLEPGATLSGMNDQLFLRASARNRAEIRKALAAIDRPLRNLMIRVSNSRGSDESSRGGSVDGRVVIGSNNRVDANARIWDTRSQRQESGSQMVQTVEGGRAFIQIGRSLPLPLRQVVVGPAGTVVSDTVVYRDIGQGFYVEPRLSGDRVTLEISQHNDTPAGRGGAANVQRLATTVSGRLGEWIALGGSGRQARGDDRGTLNLSSGDLRDERAVWLRVDPVE